MQEDFKSYFKTNFIFSLIFLLHVLMGSDLALAFNVI